MRIKKPTYVEAARSHSVLFRCAKTTLRGTGAIINLNIVKYSFIMVFIVLIGIFIGVLTCVYIYFKYVVFNFWRNLGVFFPEPVVPIGNVAAIVARKVPVGIFFQDMYMKYKHHGAFGLYTFFKPNLVITDLELIRTVLIKNFHNFHDRGFYCNEKIDPLTGHLFLLSGQKWKNMRAKLTPTFTPVKIGQMFEIAKKIGNNFAIYLENKAQMKESIEMKDMFSRYTTDVIMATAFGINSNCINEPNNKFRIYGKKILKVNSIWVAIFMFAPQIMNFFSIPITHRSVTKFYMKMFREIVEYRQNNKIINNDFVDLLMELMENSHNDNKPDKAIKLTMVEATAQSFAFFVAGFETSSATASYTLFELAQNQNIQDKLCDEIDQVLKKYGDLTYEALKNMTYLHQVIQESMRKYPSVPVLNRICTEEIDLPITDIDVCIPKGTLITIPVLGIHRDPTIYPDPDKFDPERFCEDENKKRHSCAFLSFGEGKRKCIGAQFGLMQTKVGLVCLLSNYKFKLHPRSKKAFIFSEKCIGLGVKGGIYFIIEPRK
ncbi:probable cytochrome P450 6a14 [Solenopsis invicta]|uniref:probable cytochrome P450 6a14 n=1 Tax=Solenopsis invicta TaxID=13686 RepID=UPI00193DFDDB|nr:probable cytochrome P450 6a14 [Solenopsis invicta]